MLIKQAWMDVWWNLDTHHTIWIVYAAQVDLVHKADKRGLLRVSVSTFYFQTVYPAFIDSLQLNKGWEVSSKSESQGNVTVWGVHSFVTIN